MNWLYAINAIAKESAAHVVTRLEVVGDFQRATVAVSRKRETRLANGHGAIGHVPRLHSVRFLARGTLETTFLTLEEGHSNTPSANNSVFRAVHSKKLKLPLFPLDPFTQISWMSSHLMARLCCNLFIECSSIIFT